MIEREIEIERERERDKEDASDELISWVPREFVLLGFSPLARVWLTDLCIIGNLQPTRASDVRKYRTIPSMFCIQNTRTYKSGSGGEKEKEKGEGEREKVVVSEELNTLMPRKSA